MPERQDKTYIMPWKSGRKRGKAFSVGEVFSLVIITEYSLHQSSSSRRCWCGSCKLNPSPGSQLSCARGRASSLLPRSQTIRAQRAGMAAGCRRGRSSPSEPLWSSTALICTSHLQPAFGNCKQWPCVQDAKGQGSLEEWSSLKW